MVERYWLAPECESDIVDAVELMEHRDSEFAAVRTYVDKTFSRRENRSPFGFDLSQILGCTNFRSTYRIMLRILHTKSYVLQTRMRDLEGVGVIIINVGCRK
jgi:hypothetical protein